MFRLMQFRWIAGLALGRAIRRAGYALCDAGQAVTERAAHHWHRPGFNARCAYPAELERSRPAVLEEAAAIADRHAAFAAAGGPHSCTSTNGALWYGRQQYAETIAADLRALAAPQHQAGGARDAE